MVQIMDASTFATVHAAPVLPVPPGTVPPASYSVPAGVLTSGAVYLWSVTAYDGSGHNVGTTTMPFRFVADLAP
jgi:hypothetical protein